MSHFLMKAGDFLLHRHRRPVAADRPAKPIVETSAGQAEAGPARGLAFYSLTSAPRPGGRLATFALTPEPGECSARAEEPFAELP